MEASSNQRVERAAIIEEAHLVMNSSPRQASAREANPASTMVRQPLQISSEAGPEGTQSKKMTEKEGKTSIWTIRQTLVGTN